MTAGEDLLRRKAGSASGYRCTTRRTGFILVDARRRVLRVRTYSPRQPNEAPLVPPKGTGKASTFSTGAPGLGRTGLGNVPGHTL